MEEKEQSFFVDGIDEEKEEDFEDILFERDTNQYETFVELKTNLETMEDDEWQEKYDSLDEDAQDELNDAIRNQWDH